MTPREQAHERVKKLVDHLISNLEFLDELPDFGQGYEYVGETIVGLTFLGKEVPGHVIEYFASLGYKARRNDWTPQQHRIVLENGSKPDLTLGAIHEF